MSKSFKKVRGIGLTGISEEGIPGFEWPDSLSESSRIQRNSIVYGDMEIPEAFAAFYNIKCKHVGLFSSQISNVNVGDVVELPISSVTRRCTEFNSPLFRENVVSVVNLYQYAKFRNGNYNPNDLVPCKVMYKDDQTIKVDPTQVLYQNWLGRIIGGIKQQYSMTENRQVTVHNLELHKSNRGNGGGFIGGLRIDDLSDFLGEDIFTKVFIPGSQIVLNIERNFERWIGQDVDVFVNNYIPENEGTGMPTLVCSRKALAIHMGNLNKIKMFNEYCLDTPKWKKILETKWKSVVTGIINSSKTTGVFVEIPELSITGMVPVSADVIGMFHPGDEFKVQLRTIEEPMYFNKEVGQMQHVNSIVTDGDILKTCKLNFVFDFAE